MNQLNSQGGVACRAKAALSEGHYGSESTLAAPLIIIAENCPRYSCMTQELMSPTGSKVAQTLTKLQGGLCLGTNIHPGCFPLGGTFDDRKPCPSETLCKPLHAHQGP